RPVGGVPPAEGADGVLTRRTNREGSRKEVGMAPATVGPPSTAPEHTPAELTAAEFFRLIEAGGFDRGRRLFPWRGRLGQATAMPSGASVVVDHPARRVWVHEDPVADPSQAGRRVWGKTTEVGPGQAVRLTLDALVPDPIPFEEVFA